MAETRTRFRKRIKAMVTPGHLRVIADYLETNDEAIGNAAILEDIETGNYISTKALTQIVMA